MLIIPNIGILKILVSMAIAKKIKYYYVTSTFMCNDNSYNCVYVEQAGNSNKTNEYTANFYIGIEDSEVKSLSGVLMYDDFIIINSTLN